MNPAAIAADGPLLAAVALAALAGLVSFASPCILPLLPGYVSYVTGMSGVDANSEPRRGRIALGTMLFIAGFTAVFTVLAFAVNSLGNTIASQAGWIELVAGAIIIVMGLAFVGIIPGLDRLARVRKLPRAGLAAAPVFGAVFALSWTPCLSPTLTAVLALSLTQDGTARGIILCIAYCLGLGFPFLLFGMGFRKLMDVFDFFKRHSRTIARLGGIAMIIIGLALVTGLWTEWMNWLRATVGPGAIGI